MTRVGLQRHSKKKTFICYAYKNCIKVSFVSVSFCYNLNVFYIALLFYCTVCLPA